MAPPKKRERAQARELRRQGLSITQIAERLGVSKGSVSVWVRDVPLTEQQRRDLENNVQAGGIKGREKARHANRAQRWAERNVALRRQAEALVDAHWNEPLFVAGVMLYQAEGRRNGAVEIVNSDPRILALFKRWLDAYAPGRQVTLRVRLFEDNDEYESVTYWKSRVPVQRVTVKRREGGNRSKGKLPHGVAALYVHKSSDLNRALGYMFAALIERLGITGA